MSRILLVETSTSACSVALTQADALLDIRHTLAPKLQASHLVPLIQELLQVQGLKIHDCDAIAVSEGPGSYTGLRVGVSTVKGLCFGSNKPLIAVSSLQVMAQNCIDLLEAKEVPKVLIERLDSVPAETICIITLMDARRMEVYTALFNLQGERLSSPTAKIIDGQSFSEELAKGPVIFTGDGAEKCINTLVHPNAYFMPLLPSAEGMRISAVQAFNAQIFADLAYFEPYYLKDFVVGVSTRKFF